jgi:hypothetical protein
MHMTDSIGTAEEALGAILDIATAIPYAASSEQMIGNVSHHNKGRDLIIAMVRVAMADLHARPQHTPAGIDPLRELALDYAVSLYKAAVVGNGPDWTEHDVTDTAKAFARFLQGDPL